MLTLEKKNDKFLQLVEDLKYGDLNITHLKIALQRFMQQNDGYSEEIRNIIGGFDGIVHHHFSLMERNIGFIELAYLRTKQGQVEV